jgi:GPH family glycoside/pentoside/hexuronide:cation symporter
MSWFEKAGNSIGSLLAGSVLVWIGFEAKLGAQSHHTLELMKFWYFLAPFTGALAALILIRKYELGEDRVYEIKAELARRRLGQPIEPLIQVT